MATKGMPIGTRTIAATEAAAALPTQVFLKPFAPNFDPINAAAGSANAPTSIPAVAAGIGHHTVAA
jgi:hypothetical protein